jgi:2-C-methyl-D-erythritol 4-phosphate cytidylyltransferase
MGFDKLTAPLLGRPLLRWTLEAFERCESVQGVVLVAAESRIEEFQALCKGLAKCARVVPGGRERVDSVQRGIEAAEGAEWVAVHDGARPLVTPEVIAQVVSTARQRGAAVAAEPVTDTIHRTAGGACVEHIPREGLWAMQTPQVAGRRELIAALTHAAGEGATITDEVSALMRVGIFAVPVDHAEQNFKVTWPRDIPLAEAVLQARREGGGAA